MADLISKFFAQNLTEAEEQALSETLLSSTEEALRFGAAAEAAYLSFGLPDPQWTGGGGSAPPSPWSSSFALKPLLLYPVLLTAGLAGWALWHFHTKVKAEVPSTLQVEKSISPTKPEESKILPQTLPAEKVTKSSALLPVAPPHPSLTSPSAVLTPVDMTMPIRKTFSNLSVVVRRASPGEVAVRVLRPDGTPLVLLYQGLLKSGKWGFDWDGRLSDGQLAPPGYYQIQVQSGQVVQSKNILIH